MSFDAFITACTIDEFRQHSTTYPDDFDDEDCCVSYLNDDTGFSQAYFRKYYWLHSMIAKRVAGCQKGYRAYSLEHIEYHRLLNLSGFVWELTRLQLDDIVNELEYHLQNYKDETQYLYHYICDDFERFYPLDQLEQDVKVDEDPDYPGDVCGFTLWWIADEVRLALTELKTFLAENPHNQTFVYSGSW